MTFPGGSSRPSPSLMPQICTVTSPVSNEVTDPATTPPERPNAWTFPGMNGLMGATRRLNGDRVQHRRRRPTPTSPSVGAVAGTSEWPLETAKRRKFRSAAPAVIAVLIFANAVDRAATRLRLRGVGVRQMYFVMAAVVCHRSRFQRGAETHRCVRGRC